MGAIKGSNTAMKLVNENMDVQSIQTVLKDFQKQGMKFEMQQEMMDGAMEGAFGEDVDAEADEVYQGVLDSIGVEYVDNDPVSYS